MALFNGLLGDSVSGVIKAVLGPMLPPPLRWLADLVPLIIEAVKLAEKAGENKGAVKMNAVRRRVVAALDGLDTVPGWDKLSEDSRDGLVTGLAEIVVFGMNVEKHGGLPPGNSPASVSPTPCPTSPTRSSRSWTWPAKPRGEPC